MTVPAPIVIGATYGRWTVLAAAYADASRQQRVRCVCGHETVTRWTRVRSGKSKGCASPRCRRGLPPLEQGRPHQQPRRTRAPRVGHTPLPRAQVLPGLAVAMIPPLDPRLPFDDMATPVVLTGRTRVGHIRVPGMDGAVQALAEALVEGEAEPLWIALDRIEVTS